MAEQINQSPIANEIEVFVSYAWGGESENIVNAMEEAFTRRGIRLARDKKELGFTDSISAFVQRLGRAQSIVLVISDRYLRSPACMNDLVEIDKNQGLIGRVYPIVLPDANIYTPQARLEYYRYWEKRVVELEASLEQSDRGKISSVTSDLEKYKYIRDHVDRLIMILVDMNSLTAEMHVGSGFSQLIDAIQQNRNMQQIPTETEPEAAESSDSDLPPQPDQPAPVGRTAPSMRRAGSPNTATW